MQRGYEVGFWKQESHSPVMLHLSWYVLHLESANLLGTAPPWWCCAACSSAAALHASVVATSSETIAQMFVKAKTNINIRLINIWKIQVQKQWVKTVTTGECWRNSNKLSAHGYLVNNSFLYYLLCIFDSPLVSIIQYKWYFYFSS